jgi:hypothetical protein
MPPPLTLNDDTTQQPEPLCTSAQLDERGQAWVWDVTQ